MATPSFEDLITALVGNIHGLPTILAMAVPFAIGVLAGFVLKKTLKIIVVVTILAVAASYFGFINLGSTADELKALIVKYGPEFLNYFGFIAGVIPLSLGFFIGLLVGFLLT